LDVGEFIRRFLIHVLPKGFHRIRLCSLKTLIIIWSTQSNLRINPEQRGGSSAAARPIRIGPVAQGRLPGPRAGRGIQSQNGSGVPPPGNRPALGDGPARKLAWPGANPFPPPPGRGDDLQMTTRRLPAPWTVDKIPGGYVVREPN